jgi:hypothetical protein
MTTAEEEAVEAQTSPPTVGTLATTVTNLVVTPQTNGVTVTFTTNTPVRGRLMIGTASGTYTTYTSPYGSAVIGTNHLLYGANLVAATLYHYIVQFYDQNGATLDATVDATFTTLAAPAGGAFPGYIIGNLSNGVGVPAATIGANGDYYFRIDGAASAHIYFKSAGAWTALI